MRKICIYQSFLNDEHKSMIRKTAESKGFTPFFFDAEDFEGAKECVRDAEILYAQSLPLLKEAGESLRWYCSSTAGVDLYCNDDTLFKNKDCILTNSNSFGETMAEHCVMMALMIMRNMKDYMKGAAEHRWLGPAGVKSIMGANVTLLGAGDIGTAAAKRFLALGAESTTGVCRSGEVRYPEYYTQVVKAGELETVLPKTDILIMSLPKTKETDDIINEHSLSLLPRHAILINVGRGNAIDEKALITALNEEKLAGAAIDVAKTEPIPADSPLWETKNLYITPHTSGNLTLDFTCKRNVEMFLSDLILYAEGKPLKHVVDKKRGY